MALFFCYFKGKCHILQTAKRSPLNQQNYKVLWNLRERFCNRNLCDFDAESHCSLALQSLCHGPAAVCLLLVGGDRTVVVICLNLSNIFVTFTSAFSLVNQGVVNYQMRWNLSRVLGSRINNHLIDINLVTGNKLRSLK